MKWMLVVLVLGATPVKTGLLFDSLSECVSEAGVVGTTYFMDYAERLRRANENVSKEQAERNDRFLKDVLMKNGVTCIPHAAQ